MKIRPTVVSLFTGAMGLDLGFEAVGFEVRVALDHDANAVSTVRANRPGIPVIPRDISEIPTAEILEVAGLSPGEPTVITGGSPCEPFSTIGKRLSVNDGRATMILQFLRVVREAAPRFFVFENVSGLVSAALQHVSFYKRAARKRGSGPAEEELGSAFAQILSEFKSTGYAVTWGIVDAADFGAPQHRRRLLILGSRDGPPLALPEPTHGSPGERAVTLGLRQPWVVLREALHGLVDPSPEYAPFPSWGRYLKYVPPGGCWRDLPPELQPEAMGRAYFSTGGRTGFLRRLAWDRPAPTLICSPVTKAACLCHPSEQRTLSVREYARLQGFPDDWALMGSRASKYRLIGQAVPVPLAKALAIAIKDHHGTPGGPQQQNPIPELQLRVFAKGP